MRNMSFALTTEQFRDGSKTVTRRLGWRFLKPGDVVMGCRKCQGLKPGEKLERLGPIRIVSVREEELWRMEEDDCAKEGFPHLRAKEFVTMFMDHMGCKSDRVVTRIEFEHIEAAG